MPELQSTRIAIIGLGYVGLPLAVAFSKKFPTLGYDVKQERIAELRQGIDSTREVSSDELLNADNLLFSDDPEVLHNCNVMIIAVPTPIDANRRPDLTPLVYASQTAGRALKKNDIVIYESTVYPGATEEICVPVLEEMSGLCFNRDFFCGYSPERINPGDTAHRIMDIVKVTSGSTPEAAAFVDSLYRSIITAGTFRASSIKVAEAAKVIENTQRDVNIALVNELALIFNRLDIDTMEVLQAAGTKWNFLPFQPGLVGGHCIGVDPYYLTHKAQEVGYHPEMILAGRRLNDDMGRHIASEVIKHMLKKRIHVAGSRILVMGLTFKENCPDLRNTAVINIIRELESFGAGIEVFDPWADRDEAVRLYRVTMVEEPAQNSYDAIVMAVAHQDFIRLEASDIRSYCREQAVIYDVKNVLQDGCADARL
jgi:UDP-N-acetyl-D-galactosamine dehydrogenase